jgi:hypothetical protein
VTKWEFALPTATAILAILYPDEFTVYDVVVCEEIDDQYRPQLYGPDSAWNEYEEYHKKVAKTEPAELSLRDKDRFLTGRSYYKWLEKKEYELASQATKEPE